MSKGKRDINITEDKEQNWKNFGAMRANRALEALRVLANCGNRANYAPDEEGIRKMELSLQAAVKETIDALRTGKRDARERFTL